MGDRGGEGLFLSGCEMDPSGLRDRWRRGGASQSEDAALSANGRGQVRAGRDLAAGESLPRILGSRGRTRSFVLPEMARGLEDHRGGTKGASPGPGKRQERDRDAESRTAGRGTGGKNRRPAAARRFARDLMLGYLELFFGKSFTGKTARMLHEIRAEPRLVLVDPKCAQLVDLKGFDHLWPEYLPRKGQERGGWTGGENPANYFRGRAGKFRVVVHVREHLRVQLDSPCLLLRAVRKRTLAV